MLNKLDSSIFLLFVSVEFSQIISNVVRHKTLCARAIQLNFVQAMINAWLRVKSAAKSPARVFEKVTLYDDVWENELKCL